MSFPLSPSLGDTFESDNGKIYIWTADGAWKVHGTVSDTSSPVASEGSNTNIGQIAVDADGNTLVWDGSEYVYTKGQVLQRLVMEHEGGTTTIAPSSTATSFDFDFTPKSAASGIKIQGYYVGALGASGLTADEEWNITTRLRSPYASIHDGSTLQLRVPLGSNGISAYRASQTMFVLLDSWGTTAREIIMDTENVGDIDARMYRRFLIIEEVS